MAGGRPSKYKTIINKEVLLLIEYWVLKGYTEEQIANLLNIAYSTLNEWKNKYREFSEALKSAGRGTVDDMVEGALYRKAVSGDTTACIFWLKNRRRKEWKDRPKDEQDNNVLLEVAKAIKELK